MINKNIKMQQKANQGTKKKEVSSSKHRPTVHGSFRLFVKEKCATSPRKKPVVEKTDEA